MPIEINAPCSLPLGLARLEDAAVANICWLAATLQHPPVQLTARPNPAGLGLTGARADTAHAQAVQVCRRGGLEPKAEIEIELAIPSHMGLGADALLGLSVALALAALSETAAADEDVPRHAQALDLQPQDAAAVWGFRQGGLLLVDTQPGPDGASALLRRQAVAHDDRQAWVFVFVLPKTPPGAPDTLEADRARNLLAAAPRLSAETGRVLTQALWPAAEADDLPAFAQAWMELHQLNRAALSAAGALPPLEPEEAAVLRIMQAEGALAWGQSLTGLTLFGLVQGATASVELRKKLMQHLGHFGGTAMATIMDNDGARVRAPSGV